MEYADLSSGLSDLIARWLEYNGHDLDELPDSIYEAERRLLDAIDDFVDAKRTEADE